MSSRPATRPRVVQRLLPRALSPWVLTCEHAGSRFPHRGGLVADDRALLRTHWGWDIGAWALTRELSRRLRATAVGSIWSRLWVDLNRHVGDPTLVRADAEGRPLAWNAIGPGEIEKRLDVYYYPFHTEVDRLIARHVLHGVKPLIMAVHSFTPTLYGRPRDFEIGVLYDRHRAPALRFGRALKAEGLRVRYNEPYSGKDGMMYSADRHGAHHRLPCFELEVNQGLFEQRGTAARLARVVAPALRAALGPSRR
jgi:predicted N-formylglutamate amidohydrolase